MYRLCARLFNQSRLVSRFYLAPWVISFLCDLAAELYILRLIYFSDLRDIGRSFAGQGA